MNREDDAVACDSLIVKGIQGVRFNRLAFSGICGKDKRLDWQNFA